MNIKTSAAKLLVSALAFAGLLAATPAKAATEVYFHDFQWDVGASVPEWSAGTIQSAPNPVYDGWRRFLGEFNNGETALSLSGLDPHGFVQVDFDLYLLRSWDGDNPVWGGPDVFGFKADGNNIFSASFSNGGATQSYCPGGGSACAPMSGSAEQYSLGYHFDNWLPSDKEPGTSEVMDSVYHFSFTFAHASNDLQLAFYGQGLQDFWVVHEGGQPIDGVMAHWDESWGIDNVRVQIMPVPEPGTWAMLLAGGLFVFATARRRTAARA